MTVSWTREQRAIARAQGLPLIAIAVDFSEVPAQGRHGGKVVFDGPVSRPAAEALAEHMRKFILDLQAEGKSLVQGP